MSCSIGNYKPDMDTFLGQFTYHTHSNSTINKEGIQKMLLVLKIIENGPETGVSYKELAPVFCDLVSPERCVLYSHFKTLNDLGIVGLFERVDKNRIKQSNLSDVVLIREPQSEYVPEDMYLSIISQDGINKLKEELTNLMNNEGSTL